MDVQKDLTPEFNSANLQTIIDIVHEYPAISNRDIESIELFLGTKSPPVLFALRKSLEFFFEKNSLTQSIFDFLLETNSIEKLASFLPYLEEITVHQQELLEFISKLSEVADPEKIIHRFQQLITEGILVENIDYNLFFSLITLIEIDLDEVPIINLLKLAEYPFDLANAYKILKENNLLESRYIDFITEPSSEKNATARVRAELLVLLSKHNILDTKNFNACQWHKDLTGLKGVAEILATKTAYLEKYFSLVVNKEITKVQFYIHYLRNSHLLAANHIEILANFSNTSLMNFLHILLLADNFITNSTQLLTLSFLKNSRLKNLANALVLLKHEGLLTQENFELIFSDSAVFDSIYPFVQGLIVLENNQLANPWKSDLRNHLQPLLLAFTIKELAKANILTPSNVDTVNTLNAMHFFVKLLRTLNRLNSLNKASFNHLLILDNLLHASPLYKKMSTLNLSNLFFMDVFSTLAETGLSKETRLQKIDSLLADKKYLNKPRLSINRAESTHIISIRQGFNESLQKFVSAYGKTSSPDIANIISELTAEFSDPPNELRLRAAINALQHIIPNSDFIDLGSNLSLRQLLLLLWKGIHDETQRVGTLSDAKKQLLEGLYEIQRGGNINAAGLDNGLADEPICCTGAFNKLLEKLVGVHNFVQLIFITPELASKKFPIVVNEEVNKYLFNLDPKLVFLQYDSFLLEGVSSVWKYVNVAVREQMLAEFSQIYRDSKGAIHADFENLLASHEYLSIDPDVLTGIKSSYALKEFELSIATSSTGACGSSEGRLPRAVGNCFEKNKKTSRYRPFLTENTRLRYILSFLMGLVNGEKRKYLFIKIQALQEDSFKEHAMQLEELYRAARILLNETYSLDETDIVELDNCEGKKFYLMIQRNLQNSKKFFSFYSTAMNKDHFFSFHSELEMAECVELYKSLLYPKETATQIKLRYFKYFTDKAQVLSLFSRQLSSEFAWLKRFIQHERLLQSAVPEEFLHFFLLNGEPILEPSQLSAQVLENPALTLSFPLEGVMDVLLRLSPEQQIALGKLLADYPIVIDKNYSKYPSAFNSAGLQALRMDLLSNLIDLAKTNRVLSEADLIRIAHSHLLAELISNGLDEVAGNRLLDSVIQAHDGAKQGLAKLVGGARQAIMLFPSLLQALNGHSENLAYMLGLMAVDTNINACYQRLLEHPIFIKRFPQLRGILVRSGQYIAAPLTKLLLLNSFFELSRTLADAPLNSSEHEHAKALLIDNSIIFESILAESLGLELGPGGLILDLGITIHQLLISAEYLRQQYHLHISLWEGVKFNLGFAGVVQETLLEREVLRLSLENSNRISAALGIYFNYTLISIPSLQEQAKLQLDKAQLPTEVLQQIDGGSNREFSTLKYQCELARPSFIQRNIILWRGPNFSRLCFKKQYVLSSTQANFSIFFSQSGLSRQEDNVFVQAEEICREKLVSHTEPDFPSLILASFIKSLQTRRTCTTQAILVAGWEVVASTQLESGSAAVRLSTVSPISISGALAGLMKNRNSPNGQQTIDLLVQFNARYGHMYLYDGPFLEGKVVYVLIQDSYLADFLVNAQSQELPIFAFYNNNYVHKLHYWLGQTTWPSAIVDTRRYLSIGFLPLAAEQLPKVMEISKIDELSFGEKGPRFLGWFRNEISINFNQACWLRGQFNFFADSIRLEQVMAYPNEKIQFNINLAQKFELQQASGQLRFFMEANGFDLTVISERLDYQVLIRKQAHGFFYISSHLNLKYFWILPYHRMNAEQSFFVALWQIDSTGVGIMLDSYLGSPSLQLTIEGNYEINARNYSTQLNFQAGMRHYHFFELAPRELLLFDLVSFRQMLANGVTAFSFSQNRKLEWVNCTVDYQVIYRDIHYHLDETFGLIAIAGAVLKNNSFPTESFSALLEDVPIDLRNDSFIAKIDAKTLMIGRRQLVDITAEVRLLTKQGDYYMGLLPISSYHPNNTAAFKRDTLSHSEAQSLVSTLNVPKQKSVWWKPWLLSGMVLGGVAAMATSLVRTLTSYRQHRAVAPTAAMEMVAAVGIMAHSSVVQTAPAYLVENKPFLPNQANFKKEYPAFSQARINLTELQPFPLEPIQHQLVLLQYGLGWYKKLTKKNASSSTKRRSAVTQSNLSFFKSTRVNVIDDQVANESLVVALRLDHLN